MKDWTSIVLAFALGLAVGVAFTSFFFESRVRFYKQYIEHRLASINRLRFQRGASHELPKASFWKTLLSRHSKPDGDSKSQQN
jgi:hypothetical protein